MEHLFTPTLEYRPGLKRIRNIQVNANVSVVIDRYDDD